MVAPDYDSLIDAALQVAVKRKRLAAELREAIDKGTDAEVRVLAKRFLGLYDERPNEKRPATDSRLH